MLIEVSQSLIKTIKKYRCRDWKTTITDEEIFNRINQMLLFDGLLISERNEFKKINFNFQGIVIHELKKIVHFCQMLDIRHKTRGRNTFLNQNFLSTFIFAKCNYSNYSLSISLNPYDVGQKIKIPLYIANCINELKTIGITINESLNRNGDFEEIINIDEYLTFRKEMRQKNKYNNSTIFDRTQRKIVIYGRLDGANGPNTIFSCMVLKKLNINLQEIDFFDVTPKKSNKKLLNFIVNLGFKLNNVNHNEVDLAKRILKGTRETISRDQKTFKANIIKKYLTIPSFNINECMACDYGIEINFEAAHIYSCSDIIKDYENNLISSKVAAHLIVSGDNGFLLCSNCHKEFDKGQIYFDLESKNFCVNKKRVVRQNDYQKILKRIKE